MTGVIGGLLTVLISQPLERRMPVDHPSHAVEGNAYIGSDLCASCHAEQAQMQAGTPMANAMVPAVDSEILQRNPDLTFRQGPYHYKIELRDNEVVYSVSDGRRSISVPIAWALGVGEFGQTYLLNYDGRLFESRVSFYPNVPGLDLTVGVSSRTPGTLEEALGQLVRPVFAKRCFSCHSTGAVHDRELRTAAMTPGITCEGCHGPGEQHLAVVEGGQARDLRIYNPGHWSTDEVTHFCGSCHRTLEDVVGENLRGPITVRFQPYRLVLSPCYSPSDPRISCTACHDPHQPRMRDAASYDEKCLSCHTEGGNSGDSTKTRGCPVGTRECTSCHMPRVSVPQTHFTFSDHLIRVVAPGESFAGRTSRRGQKVGIE